MRDEVLVRRSARLMEVSIRYRIIRSRSTQSQSVKYFMSMCLVWGVGFCAFAIDVQPSSSSYATVAASCGISRSHSMLLTKRHIQPMSHAVINSASVDDSGTVGWNLVLYAIVPPASWMQIPLSERCILTLVAQSELPYATAVVAL